MDKRVEWDNLHSKIKMETLCDKDLLYFLHRADIRKKKVLEIGCGQGRNLHFLEKFGVNCTGVDFSEVALEKAKKENIELRCEDIRKMSFDSEAFGCVIDVVTLASIKKKELLKTFREVGRVLKKGGLFFLKELTENNDIRSIVFRREETTFFSIEELTSKLRDAGFEVLETEKSFEMRFDIEHYTIIARKL
jgi:SAM-dependent methyltransferase